jgi:signal transduction histidine kinase
MSLETAMQDIHEAKPAAQVGRAFEHVRTAIAEVRTIVQNLRPSMLEEFGLVATLELLCHELEVSHPTIEVNCMVEDRHAKVSTPLCVAMVRILQEALTNAAKHSGATQVDVTVTLDPEAATLKVVDNGSGFDASRLPVKGFGLSSMKDRGRQSGGLVQFHSIAGEGTTVEVRWDLDPSDPGVTSGTHKAIRYGVSGNGSSVP